MNSRKTIIRGRIVSLTDGEKSISRSFIYGYMVLSVQVGSELYSILVNSSKINQYGFLPRIGHYVEAEGIRAPSRDGIHDYSMSHLSSLKHIDPPKRKQIR